MVETMHNKINEFLIQEIKEQEEKNVNSFRKDVFFERMNNLKLSGDISEIIWCSFNQ